MIAGIFHQGSGLGNQLHRYVAIRTLALDKGYDYGMFYHSDNSGKDKNFKGQSFMDIDWGKPVVPFPHKIYSEKKVVENGVDIRGYDPEFNFVEDDTLVDGEFQDERYWGHREEEVDEWLKVEPIDVPDDVCMIGFRGGEYTIFPDLFLPIDYWNKAIDIMLNVNPKMKFEVHTDDPATASLMFPGYPVIHDIGINWRSMRYAKHAIIANSSFYILPRWLRNGYTIAPRYWARHNTRTWALSQNYYSRFKYI
jgi:hypothetical protein